MGGGSRGEGRWAGGRKFSRAPLNPVPPLLFSLSVAISAEVVAAQLYYRALWIACAEDGSRLVVECEIGGGGGVGRSVVRCDV